MVATMDAGIDMSKGHPQATATVQLDNDRAKVTLWHFVPGAHTGWHRHEMDYVVVPLTTGALTIDDGKSLNRGEMRMGVSYARPAGVEHDVINANDFEFSFVEIELK